MYWLDHWHSYVVFFINLFKDLTDPSLNEFSLPSVTLTGRALILPEDRNYSLLLSVCEGIRTIIIQKKTINTLSFAVGGCNMKIVKVTEYLDNVVHDLMGEKDIGSWLSGSDRT